MSRTELNGTTALVTGAGRGFGLAIADALRDVGADVVTVARNDVTDPVAPGSLLERHRPKTLVLNAGAQPMMRPIQHQTWEAFSRNWDVDVRQAFHWIREALLMPLAPGSTVIAMSSGAALFGSPLSGGYAGAKAMIRFMAGYAADESAREGLGIRFISVLPKLTPTTDLGARAVAAYARRDGIDVDEVVRRLGPSLDPGSVGKHIADLASSTDHGSGAYLLTPDGLKETA